MSAVSEKKVAPDTWELVPLKELGRWSGGGTPSKAKPEYWTKGKIPWVSPKDMKTEHITDSEDHITKAAVTESTAKLIPAGSVLIVTRSGILRHTLPVAVSKVPVTVNQDLKVLTPREGILPEYVAWALRCFAREILKICSKHGTTVNSIEMVALQRFEIPVASLDQQKRIVAEIEKQFSRLDEAVANLNRVKANLKRYKAAVLKAAVEGRLVETEAELARREGRSYETGAQLLQRILEARRSQWKGKGKYKEPAAPDTADLPDLPVGWVWGTFGHLCRIQGGFAFKSADYKLQGVPLVRISNLVKGSIQLEEDTVFLPDNFLSEFAEFRLEKGDTLIAMSGATTGKMANFALDRPALLNQRVGRFKPTVTLLTASGYISLLAMHASGKVLTKAYGAAQPNISPTEIEAMPVGVPPLAEQDRIVAEIDRRLSLIRGTEVQVGANLQRAKRMRQSILARAFSVDASLYGKRHTREMSIE